MATFNLARIINQLKSLFTTYGNIFQGYEISDGNVESKGGQCSAEYIYQPTIAGDTTDVRVVISTINTGEAFDEELSFIENMSWKTIEKNPKIFQLLTGLEPNNYKLIEDPNKYRDEESARDAAALDTATHIWGSDTYHYDIDSISLETIERHGQQHPDQAGLLGVDFTKAKPNQISVWRDFALNKLLYNLLCETELDDAGKVDNQSLMKCVKWIHNYMDFVRSNRDNTRTSKQDENAGVEVKKQLSKKEIKDRQADNEKQINSEDDAIQLVMPILARIQGELKKMYQDKSNSDLNQEPENDSDDESEDNSNEKSNEPELKDLLEDNQGNNQSENTQNNGGDNVNPNSQYADNADIIESKHISVTLKKVQASSDLEILSLDSNYLPGDTLNDVDEIINQDEFIDTLTEEPQTFDIKVDDDGFDIEKCEECKECDPCASLCEVFKTGIRAYRNLYILHWMSSGNDMMKLHNLSEEMYDELKDEIDTVGELLVEKQGTVPQLDFPCDYIPVQKYDFQTGLDQIKSLIQMYIDCIDYAYCNQDSDVQSTLDEWLRYWNKQLNYFVKGQEI